VVPAPGHRDIRRCCAGVFPHDQVCGAGGGSLGAIDGAGVGELDMVTDVGGGQDPLAAASGVPLHSDDHTISCAAYPGKVLQPADGSTASGVAVVLGEPGSHSPVTIPNPWIVQSPLLPYDGPLNA
jgi:hypothetical protein